MPLLVARHVTPPEPPTTPPPPLVEATWTAPDGAALDLMDRSGRGVIITHDGVDGLGAAPRAVTRRPRAIGGTVARWSHADERLLTLPLAVLGEPSTFVQLRRDVALAFLSTTPAAGVPRTGTLRITRGDGSWREIGCLYVDGLGWTDEAGQGITHDRVALQLVAPDPWWYGAEVVALDFATSAGRSYFAPYETVSPDRALGSATVDVIGDVAASPVWTITGPATSVTVRYASNGPGWTFGAVKAGETITLDVETYTVTDNTGANRIANVAWPSSTLFQLPPGPNELLLSLAGGVVGQSEIRLTYRPRWETA